MDSYTGFAEVYDTFMDETPYKDWCSYIVKTLKSRAVMPGALVLDLGCGTGTLTQMLGKAGYDMIGVDNSQDMLNIAIQKQEKKANIFSLQCSNIFKFHGFNKVVENVQDVCLIIVLHILQIG